MNEPVVPHEDNLIPPQGGINQQAENSTIGGGIQGTQGNGNIQIYNQIDISSLQIKNRTLEDRVNQLQKEFRDFQQKYEKILNAFEKFRNIALEQLENLSPDNIDTKIALTELLTKTLQYQLEFESANNALKACQEAAEWLSANRSKLVLDAQNFIKSYEKVVELEVSSKKINDICKVIDCYLFWIGNEMAIGRTPNNIPEDIPIVLPKEIYVKAFEFIKHKISVDTHDLPKESISYLITYLTRFIIQPLLIS
ncbi:MAG: hypothetical protein IGS39_04375 [Calothrix sp. C42_A2020_038]|nr:hypothetical protein [Calothrix sp. C42_A2020_038]